MNTFKKFMITSSAAVITVISVNSFAAGEGIGGRAWVIYQDKPTVNAVEEPTHRNTQTKTERKRYRGEGIGGRAWVVDQAKYQ